MVAYITYTHHFGSGVFSSFSPSHSWPVVSRPVTMSFSILVGTVAAPQRSSSSGMRPCRSIRDLRPGQ